MESNAIYTTSDAGLSRFFGKIYGLVGMGVGLSAVISYLMLFPLSHVFVNIRKPLFSKLSLALPLFSLSWHLSELPLSEIYQAWLSSLWQP